MRDENGNVAPTPIQPPPSFRGSAPRAAAPFGMAGLATGVAAMLHASWTIGLATFSLAGLITAGFGASILKVRLGWLRRMVALRSAATRAFERTPPPGPDPTAGRAPVRLRGRVRVVRTVPFPGDARLAAAFWSDGEQACGRFAVHGADGLGVVDDDAFEIWRADEHGEPVAFGGMVAEGDEVVVAGPAALAPAPDAVAAIGTGDYRGGGGGALVFDGRADDPVRIAILPPTRR